MTTRSAQHQDPVAITGLTTQVGALSVAASASGIVAVAWAAPDDLGHRIGRDRAQQGQPADQAEEGRRQLAEYFAGTRRFFDVPLDWSLTSGTPLTVLHWLAANVEFGTSISYGQLAARSGTSLPARGIGSLMAANPMPLLVPCHRVLAVGGLGGYSGGADPSAADGPAESERPGGRTPYGLETKRWLLTFEQILPPTLGWDPARPLQSAWIG